jgi:hypothetical protein
MHSEVQVQLREPPLDIEAMIKAAEPFQPVGVVLQLEHAPRTDLVFPRTHPMGPRVVRVPRRGEAPQNNPIPRGARVYTRQADERSAGVRWDVKWATGGLRTCLRAAYSLCVRLWVRLGAAVCGPWALAAVAIACLCLNPGAAARADATSDTGVCVGCVAAASPSRTALQAPVSRPWHSQPDSNQLVRQGRRSRHNGDGRVRRR